MSTTRFPQYNLAIYPPLYNQAELWGSVVLSLLFWGFANDINTVDEAKSYYPLFGLVANLALILSGQYVRWTSVIRAGKNVTSYHFIYFVNLFLTHNIFPLQSILCTSIIYN